MRRFLFVLLAALVFVAPASAWTWPASGPVLLAYSFDPAHPYAAGQHRGIDVGGVAGETIQAPAGGLVTYVGSVPGSGRSVTILTSDGWSVTITQLGSIAVAKGATVAEGDGIGTIGPSGDPEVGGPYVQLGIRHADQDQGYVDPAGVLPPRPADTGPATPVVDPAAAAPASAAPAPTAPAEPALAPSAATAVPDAAAQSAAGSPEATVAAPSGPAQPAPAPPPPVTVPTAASDPAPAHVERAAPVERTAPL